MSLTNEIPVSQAIAMVYYHKKNRIDPLTTVIGKQDTRFVDHDLDRLLSGLQKMKADYGADKVRFYFGVHAPDHPNPDYQDMQVVIMVPVQNGVEVLVQPGTTTEASPLDEGGLCPPPWPCATSGASIMNAADDPGYEP
jgi:hypothetical protein